LCFPSRVIPGAFVGLARATGSAGVEVFPLDEVFPLPLLICPYVMSPATLPAGWLIAGHTNTISGTCLMHEAMNCARV
jgi:hypothetical protein